MYADLRTLGKQQTTARGTEHDGNKAHPGAGAAAMGPADGKAYNLISDSEAIDLGLRTTKA
jgi:hypothetical protein